MVQSDGGEFLLHNFSDYPPPKPASGEDVGLVDRMNGQRRSAKSSEVSSQSSDPLDFSDAVGTHVRSDGSRSFRLSDDGFGPVPKVDPANKFSDDDDGNTRGDLFFERGVGHERRGREVSRSNVGVETKSFSELEETQLGSEGRVSSPFRPTNSTYRFRDSQHD